jgi:ferric-dicitrate binding protein FerR (iron transport regulator)
MSHGDVTFDDFSSSKKRQKRITQIAVALGCVFAIVMVIKFLSLEKMTDVLPGTLAKIQTMSGTMLIKRGADTVEYEPGFIVLAGDTFQTIGDSTATIIYLDDNTKITIGPDTTILFNGNIGGKRTNLSAGTVTFVIPEQPKDKPMVLASYNADATVVRSGTFIQQYNGLATHLDVQSGELEVRRYSDGRVTRLTAGQTHTCRPDDMGVIQFNPDGLE